MTPTERPSDRWRLVPASWDEVVNGALHRFLNARRALLDPAVRFVPLLAATHLATARATALEANRAGRHAIALALARQAIESLTIIEAAMIDPPWANDLLIAWQAGKATQGALRKRLAELSWPRFPDTPWGVTWLEHMTSLARALQPYAHYSPDLLQWNLAFVTQPSDGNAVAAVGHGAFDQDKAERLALLFGVLLWNVLMLLSHYGDQLDAEAAAVKVALDTEFGQTKWLDQGLGWVDQLIPHVWIPE